jgi:hypothetical protein
MTSSLPNFAAAPVLPGAAPVAASLADLGAAGPTSPAGDFADFLPAGDAVAECPATATATPSFTVLGPTFFTLLAPAADPAALAGVPEMLSAENVAETEVVTPEGVSRDAMEQAASLFAALVQTLLPLQAAVPEASSVSSESMVPTAARRDAGSPIAGQVPEGTRPGVPGTSIPVASAAATVEVASPHAPAPVASTAPATSATASAAVTPRPETAAAEAGSAMPSCTFEAHLAADGAVEINATLPASKEQGSTHRSATGAAHAHGPFEIQAELALPGQAVVRLSASDAPANEIHARANFAGKNSTGKIAAPAAHDGSEIKFVMTGDKELTTDSIEAGIAVAKPEATMKTTPTEETRATSNLDTFLGLPARGEFTVAWPSADRHSAPPTLSYEMNFAQRAVATVSNLVDTQFNASMQKSGSVQLRLKFGGEDLSVRVELRDGAVHTDFRTDSPELRAALHREWQAVATQSTDALRRYADPVFSPSGDTSTPFNGRQQQAAQQDFSQQQRSPRAPEEEASTFTRRSLVGEHFAPQPAPARTPALLPTSLRLSVLA